MSLGDIAPLPLIAGVALLILRASADAPSTTTSPAPAGVAPRTAAVLLVAHAVVFGAFVAASFAVRDAHGQAPVAASLGWAALLATSLALLAAFAFAGHGAAPALRSAAGPLSLAGAVGAAAWSAGRGTGELWHPLARLTLLPVAALVQLCSPDRVVDADRFMVGTERFYIRVDPICSGYEGMGLVAVLLGAFVWTQRKTLRFPHALALPVLAVIGAFLANVARITALIYVGSLGFADVAMGGFHSKAGWLLSCAVALGATFVARRATVFSRVAGPRGPGVATENPTAAYLAPLLAQIAASLVAGLASDGGLDHLEIVAVVAAVLALAWAWPRLRPAFISAPAGSLWLPVLAGVAVFALWVGLDTSAPAENARRAAEIGAQLSRWGHAHAALWIATRVVASVVVVPVVEELAFRGFLLRRLVAADFTSVAYGEVTPLAMAVSTAAFGALHDRWLVGTLAGLAYAAVARRSGRLTDAVLAHAVTNALIAALAVGAGRWSLWG